MTNLFRIRGVALSAWLLLSPTATLPAMAQLGAPPTQPGLTGAPTGTLHIHGTVVDGVTGKPIARALVTSPDRRLATMTDSEGAFALEVSLERQSGGVPGGVRIDLAAQKPGYLTQANRQPAASIEGTAGESQATRLKLMPAAAVAGHVSTDRSDAAHHVFVNLLFRSVNNGERTWVRIAMHRTDAEGSFRFDGLNPGEYTVMTEEWRGDQPLPPEPDAITEQCPPVFLGDAADMASANKLQLHFGETAQADLHLHTATYYPVTVPVTGNAESFVNVRIAGADAFTGFHLGYVPNHHAVEGSLPDGDYGLELTGYAAANRQAMRGRMPNADRSYGVTSLHIAGGPVHTVPVALVTPAPIVVRIHTALTGKDAPQHFKGRVYLQPVEQGQSFVSGSTEEGRDDEIILPGAAPGQYTVQVQPNYGYPAEIRSGGTDLRAEKLTVTSGGSQPIDIVVRDDMATVDGVVNEGSGKSTEAAASGQRNRFVVLTPVDGNGRLSMAGADPDGHFSMQGVVPGRYRVFAMDGNLWNSPYRSPEGLRDGQDIGTAVNVAANAKLQIEAPLLDASALETK